MDAEDEWTPRSLIQGAINTRDINKSALLPGRMRPRSRTPQAQGSRSVSSLRRLSSSTTKKAIRSRSETDKDTPRTMIQQYLKAHDTVHPPLRKKSRVEDAPNNTSQQTPNTSQHLPNTSQHTKPALASNSLNRSGRRRPSLAQMMLGRGTPGKDPTPRTLIRGFLANAPSETPVSVPSLQIEGNTEELSSVHFERLTKSRVNDSLEESEDEKSLSLQKSPKKNASQRRQVTLADFAAGVQHRAELNSPDLDLGYNTVLDSIQEEGGEMQEEVAGRDFERRQSRKSHVHDRTPRRKVSVGAGSITIDTSTRRHPDNEQSTYSPNVAESSQTSLKKRKRSSSVRSIGNDDEDAAGDVEQEDENIENYQHINDDEANHQNSDEDDENDNDENENGQNDVVNNGIGHDDGGDENADDYEDFENAAPEKNDTYDVSQGVSKSRSQLSQDNYVDDEADDDNDDDDYDDTVFESQTQSRLMLTKNNTIGDYSPLTTPVLRPTPTSRGSHKRHTPALTSRNVAAAEKQFASKSTQGQAHKIKEALHKAKGKSPNSKKVTKKAITSLPPSLTRGIFTHFAKSKVSRAAHKAVEEIAEQFWDNMAEDLVVFARHAHRNTVEEADVELLMKRQGFVTNTQSMYTLVEQYLPLEYRQEIIPIARSGNRLEPKS